MGFFDRFKTKDNKPKNDLTGDKPKVQQVHPITCPFCGAYFQPNQVLFAFSRGEVERENEDLSPAQKKERVYFSIFDDSCDVHYACGMPMKMTHKASRAVSVMRVCPNKTCHQVLSPNAGLYEMGKGIFFLGLRNSGKTVMLSTIINTLKNVAHFYGAKFNHYNAGVGQKYEELYYGPLYRNHMLPKATARGKSDLLVYEWISKQYSTTIAFYDIAGEDAEDENTLIEQAGTQISNAQSYVLLVDPYEIGYISNIKQKKAASYKETVDIFNNIIDHVVLPDERRKKYLSIVLTKSDELVGLTGEPLFRRDTEAFSKIYENMNHAAGRFPVRERANLGNDISNFFKDKAPNIVSNADLTFDKQNIGYFIVSALGMAPVEDTENGYSIPNDPMPIRVEEPVLWLLYKMGYIDGEI
ncbi:hypothetical protein [Candidatus Soleaferrea massiliensis]|uniref:hypothetical protein n=1 Tax=Candidatus Soleaferrea massiliensis TaxID=1470354 RepID=UPI00058E281E|nr:hypothetical protein [Candidatus Soleaferrea massiliensis]